MKSKTKKNPKLPNVNKWKPREKAMETLSEAFLKRCQHIEQKINLLSSQERQYNIDNYDSGLGVQGIIRKEIEKLLPKRYTVNSGVVDDRNGRTAGDCDILIYNSQWFPIIKYSESERSHFPIESLYSIIEIKETLDYATFDKAMEKLVICNRLHRPATNSTKITENTDLKLSSSQKTTNPLYCAIIATKLKEGISFESLANRFFDINSLLKRKEIVRSLCVFGQGAVTWGIRRSGKGLGNANFMKDRHENIVPVYHEYDTNQCAIYPLVVNLLTHLYLSILGPSDIHVNYGSSNYSIRSLADPKMKIPPDQNN